MNRSADISECGQYRYGLSRHWRNDGTLVLFIMLNPSTADAERDDATIRKCIGFATRWGDSSLLVANLFAWRSTHPRDLLGKADPVGPANDATIRSYAVSAHCVVLAWGSHAPVRHLIERRAFEVRKLLRDRPLFTLGHAKDGNPRHPLMLPYETELQPVRHE